MADTTLSCGIIYLKVQFQHWQEFPPAPGSIISTSIFQWSFRSDSFWRQPDMATVLDIAKSIALVGWREARLCDMFGCST